MLIRYTSWSGTKRVVLEPDRLFEELSKRLTGTDDLDEALDQVLRDRAGHTFGERLGLEELLAAVRDRMRDLATQFNFESVFDEHRARLDELLDLERDEVARVVDPNHQNRLRTFLRRLPSDVRETIDRLIHHAFLDDNAQQGFGSALNDREDLERIGRFVERHGGRFRGKQHPSFEQALEVIEQVDALQRLEDALFNREFSAVDLDLVERWLGAAAARAIAAMRSMIASLSDSGLAARKGGKLVLSPKGARRLGEQALREVHEQLRLDASGSHALERFGNHDVELTGTRSYRYGDGLPFAPVATVANAARRGSGLPLRLRPEDLTVFDAKRTVRSATVLLLDMSWSMSWEGRFAAAKKVALAMQSLMRKRYPRDFFAVVGFYTRAVRLNLAELSEATWNMGDPFTNLQDGLRLGGELLNQQRAGNKNIIVVTDGQPTAYYIGGRLYCEWPMSLGGLSTRATVETLREVERVTRKNVRINTFMLDDSPPLRAFVDKMTAINRGRAFYTTPSELGRYVLVDYVGRRRKMIRSQ